ncbi:cytochrome c oxidase assembly protein [Ilumatobacter nonamiensis]|uniref:cytochrome c oxidase assembly protein n=1 Tax=Ilumatobacter nonamiensis TaxID=467093 RepID=UPI000346F3AF|nr:cytochrome c oxidase assembly protein [Ilumatobacter nonamiensis]
MIRVNADVVAGTVSSPWTWEPRPDVWVLMATLGLAYWWSLARLRPRLPDAPPMPSVAQQGRFALGVIVLWLAVDWPMDLLGDDYLFSAHMVQFLLITMIAVPLFVVGIPTWMWCELTHPVRGVIRIVNRAPVALLLFQAVLVGTHLPSVVDLYASNSFVHFSLHALWVVAAGIFWLPILGKEPFVKPLQPPAKIVYLIAATIIPTVPASFLTWTETAFYEPYANAPRLWGISPVLDLQLAGLVMKLGGGLILWSFIVAIFARWAAEETRPDSNSPSATTGSNERLRDRAT